MSPPRPESAGAGGAADTAGLVPPAARRRGARVGAALIRGLVAVTASAAALYVGAYFALNTSAANGWLERGLLRRAPPEAVTVRRVQWGPRPGWVWLVEPRGHAPDGRRNLRAHAVGLRLALDPAHPLAPIPTAVVATRARVLDAADGVALGATHLRARLLPAPRGQLHLTGVRAEAFTVDLGWDAHGRSSVRHSFRLRTPGGPGAAAPPAGPKPPAAPRRRVEPLVRVDDVALHGGTVRLRWPARVLDFHDVQALGAVTLGGPDALVITAEARAHASALTEGRGPHPRRLEATRVAIDGFRWRGAGFESHRVVLAGPPAAPPLLDAVISLGPRAPAPEGAGSPALHIRGQAHMPGDTLTRWLGRPWLPEGASLRELDLTAQGKTLSVTARVEAPRVEAPDVALGGVRGQVDGTVTLGAVLPTGALNLRDAEVDELRGPGGLSLQGARVEQVAARVATDATLTLRGLRARALAWPAGRVTGVEAQGKAELGLRGGRYRASLATHEGRATLGGTLTLQLLLGKRLRFQGAAELSDLRGALARLALQATGAEGAAASLTPPLSGALRFRGTLTPTGGGPGGRAWVPRASVDSGRWEDAAGRLLRWPSGGGAWQLVEEAR